VIGKPRQYVPGDTWTAARRSMRVLIQPPVCRLPDSASAERVGDLVSGMVAALTGDHWNTTDVDALAAGEDAGGRKLPLNVWMALLCWAGPPLHPRASASMTGSYAVAAEEPAGRCLWSGGRTPPRGCCCCPPATGSRPASSARTSRGRALLRAEPPTRPDPRSTGAGRGSRARLLLPSRFQGPAHWAHGRFPNHLYSCDGIGSPGS